MKLVFFCALCLLICYIGVASSATNKASTAKESPGPKNQNGKKTEKKTAANKNSASTAAKKTKDHSDRQRRAPPASPFDKTLDKLSKCALASTSSPSLVEVMQDNLKELHSSETYASLFKVIPHTTAFLKKKKQDSKKFIGGLRQALNADWAVPAWVSWKETEPLFQPLKQQFVYALMRFKCNDVSSATE